MSLVTIYYIILCITPHACVYSLLVSAHLHTDTQYSAIPNDEYRTRGES